MNFSIIIDYRFRFTYANSVTFDSHRISRERPNSLPIPMLVESAIL
ncbi:MAG TPA: hypothetical protein PKD64_01610 [Pirellulaceae bacterium]|nr:hypothetical protein [Pirellulaceae bacterium]HMO90866.1 hypothetical protein [Pirellulaceae bacterium]HMP68658.1 hypothetical protein [Pirellulaceae bacterium]